MIEKKEASGKIAQNDPSAAAIVPKQVTAPNDGDTSIQETIRPELKEIEVLLTTKSQSEVATTSSKIETIPESITKAIIFENIYIDDVTQIPSTVKVRGSCS